MKKKLILLTFFINIFVVHAQFYSIKPPEHTLKISTKVIKNRLIDNTNVIKDPLPSNYYVKARTLLSLPLDTIIVTSKYGYRIHPISHQYIFHRGIDIRARGNYIYSIMDGIIIHAGKDKKLGNYVKIKHGPFITIYGHLRKLLTKKGNKVSAGDEIGISGSTGNSTGEHLHFQIEYQSKIINPLPILQYIEKIKEKAKQQLIPKGIS